MATAGKTSVGGSEDLDSTNDGDVDGPYTVGAGSTITEFHAYLRSSGGGASDPKFRPIIYADNAGEPGNLIATLPEIVIPLADTTGAWRDVIGLSVSTGSNTAIWIGLWFNGVNHRYAYDIPGGTPSRYDAGMLTYSSVGDAPASWDTAGDAPAAQEKSIYVVYSPATATIRPDQTRFPKQVPTGLRAQLPA